MTTSYASVEYILQYTGFLVIGATLLSCCKELLMVSFYPLIDLTGVTVLAVNSYHYHRYLYELLSSTHDRINVFGQYNGVLLYYIDLASILTRSFLGTVTKFKYYGPTIHPVTQNIFYWICSTHLISLFICYFLLNYIYDKKMYVACRNNIGPSQKYISLVHCALFIPTGLSLWFISLDCNNVTLVRAHYAHNVLIGLITFFKPCGMYNHVLLHMLIMVQGYFIGSCYQCITY